MIALKLLLKLCHAKVNLEHVISHLLFPRKELSALIALKSELVHSVVDLHVLSELLLEVKWSRTNFA
jgi:hypothetical protein